MENDKMKIPCQCKQCNEIFAYADAKIKQEKIFGIITASASKVCPNCGGNFTVIDDKTTEYFDRHLNINCDKKYF